MRAKRIKSQTYRIDDAGLHHVDVLAGLGVHATCGLGVALGVLEQATGDDGT